MEQSNQHLEAIQKWQEEDKEHRAVIVLTAEISNETEESYSQESGVFFTGSGKNLIRLLKNALASNDKALVNMVKQAVSELAIESIIKKVSRHE